MLQNTGNARGFQGKLTQIMFKTRDLPAFYVAVRTLHSSYASGHATGLVLDVGDGVAHGIVTSWDYLVKTWHYTVKCRGSCQRTMSQSTRLGVPLASGWAWATVSCTASS